MSSEPDNSATQPSVPLAAEPAGAAAAEAEHPAQTAAQTPDEQGPPAYAGSPIAVTGAENGSRSVHFAEGAATSGSETAATEVSSQAAEHTETPESPEAIEAMNEQLVDQYAAQQRVPAEGEVIEGRVIALSDLGVVVDIGAKSEGLIPAQEFVESESGIPLVPGQVVEVQPSGEHKDGYLLLSYQRVRRRRVWDRIEKSYREQTPLSAQVVDRIKGGLVVDVGVRAFLPASQIDLRPTHDLDALEGQRIECRVLKMNRKRGNVVVSRRVILEEELKAQRERLMDMLVEGQVVTGKVKNITDYGVFVDLGGLDGLVHITDLSWARVKHPSEVVTPGQEMEVKVLKFDREKMRVSLSRKQLLLDPWATVPERFPVGARVSGRVVSITDYGAFVELDTGIEGLVHISEMSWSKRLKHPSKIVSVGDAVEVVVLDVRPAERRISLGLKQAMPDPWQALAEKYPVGTVVTGRVRNLTDFGAFVEMEEGFDGLIHVSDISWTERVKNPAEVFKKGEMVQARVLKIDPVARRVSLGVKQVNDIWAEWFTAHHVNDLVRGRVTRMTTFGAFVELAPGIEGLCHISEIEDRRKKGDANAGEKDQASRGAKATGPLERGKEYEFKIIKTAPEQHKIGLSYRAAAKQAERRDMEEYRSSKSSPTATLGDVFFSKRGAT